MSFKERFPGVDRVLRLILTTIVGLWCMGFIYLFMMSEMQHTASAGSLARFAWDRIFFVGVAGLLVPLVLGALTTRTAAPYSPRIPAAIVAAVVFLLGLGAYVSDRQLFPFTCVFVSPWAFLLGVEVHARTLRRKELKRRFETRARAAEAPKVPV